MITALLFALGGAPAFAADCEAPSSISDLQVELSGAETAFSTMDLEAFEARHAAALDLLTCLGEGLMPADAASIHRVRALKGFLDEDRGGTVASFRAAVSLQPAWVLPEGLAPVGHPLREQYETAKVLPPSPRQAVAATEGRGLTVDGSRGVGRPTAQPAVLQAFAASGAVAETALVGVGEPLPDWVIDEAAVVEDGPVKREKTRRGGPKLALLVPTAVAGAGAAGLYGLAWSSRSTYLDESTPYSELDGLRTRTNTSTVAAGALGGVAVGLGVATALTWEW